MKDLVLIGASGVAHEIIDTVIGIGQWKNILVLDDEPSTWGKVFYRGVVILGGQERISDLDISKTEFLVTFSSPVNFLKREECVKTLRTKYPSMVFATVIDPAVSFSETATWGSGCYFASGVVLDANARVADHCIVLFNSVISRFVSVGEYSFVSASVNITGGKTVGASCYLGVKSTINANVGNCVLVSAGSIVRSTVESHSICSNEVKENIFSYPSRTKMQTMLSVTSL